MLPSSLRCHHRAVGPNLSDELVLRHLVDAARPDPLLDGGQNRLSSEHSLESLKGLYQNQEAVFNPKWNIPEFPYIHLSEEIVKDIPSRKWKLLMPARIYVPSAFYYPHEKAVKNKYPDFIHEHQRLVLFYIWELYKKGILYLRHSAHEWKVKAPLYSWEEKLLRKHNVTNGGPVQISRDLSMGSSLRLSMEVDAQPKLGRVDSNSLHSVGAHSPVSPVAGKCYRTQSVSRNLLPDQRSSTNNTRYSKPKEAFKQQRSRSRRSSRTSKNYLGNNSPSNSFSGSCQSVRSSDTRSYQSRDSCPGVKNNHAANSSNSAFSVKTNSTPTKKACSKGSPVHNTSPQAGPSNGKNHSHSTNSSNADPSEAFQHGCILHVGRTRIPNRVTGGVFLVDKNPRNAKDCRLVVDFSQFSREPNAVSWPRFASPNLSTLAELLPSNLQWVSLDVSAAFYHIPITPHAAARVLIGLPRLSWTDFDVWNLPAGMLKDLYNCGKQDLLLLLRENGRHLYLPERTLGFRKLPMGIGISPFFLAIFSAVLCQFFRRTFHDVFAFAYMDDIVLGCKSDSYLVSVVHAILDILSRYGIAVNPDKTKWSGNLLHFLGLELSPKGWLPQSEKQEKINHLLHAIDTRCSYDFKVLQRLTGHLAFHAPFTLTGYPLLIPLYKAIQAKANYKFSNWYKSTLIYWYSHLVPKRPIWKGWPQVFADATPEKLGVADYCNHLTKAWDIPQLPIHVAELLAVLMASRAGHKIIGCDNQIVCSKKFTSFPWSLACIANIMLHDVSLLYISSKDNPADLPSRNIAVLLQYPKILPKDYTELNHVNLTVFPVQQDIPPRPQTISWR